MEVEPTVISESLDSEPQLQPNSVTEFVSAIKEQQELLNEVPESVSESGNFPMEEDSSIENNMDLLSNIKGTRELLGDSAEVLLDVNESQETMEEICAELVSEKGEEKFEDVMEVKETVGTVEKEYISVFESQEKKGHGNSLVVEEKQWVEEVLPEPICGNADKKFEHLMEVKEKVGTVEKDLNSVFESQNLAEMIKGPMRCGDFLEIKETQKVVENVSEKQEETSFQSKEKQQMVEIHHAISNAWSSDGWNEQGSSSCCEVSEIKEKKETMEFQPAISNGGNYDGSNEQVSSSGCQVSESVLHKNVKQETVGKKEKRPRRRGKRNVSEIDGKRNVVDCTKNGCEKNGSGRRYSRNEMEALRFVNTEGQQIMWNSIYQGLGTVVAREFEEIADGKQQKQFQNSGNQGQEMVKKYPGAILDDICFQDVAENIEEVNFCDIACSDFIDYNDSFEIVQEVLDDYDEDEDSDDEYDSIQRRAFSVEGDPDFESGPPQDGLEYLRRVRWEAAQIPRVKIAKVEKSKLIAEQTPYMPNIPDIAKCPDHLLPSKVWEDAFLADFSELRLSLSHYEISGNERSCRPLSVKMIDEECGEISKESQMLKNTPMLSVILGMDAVSRASMLRKRISTLETAITLSRHESIWLFALCAAVDTPLDAGMSASLRCLLRKCASLRAKKTESDDELVMLNILVTIAGRYFGQLEI